MCTPSVECQFTPTSHTHIRLSHAYPYLLPTLPKQDIQYTKLECVGRGGSSKVYKVMAPNRKIFALKRIRLQVGGLWLQGWGQSRVRVVGG